MLAEKKLVEMQEMNSEGKILSRGGKIEESSTIPKLVELKADEMFEENILNQGGKILDDGLKIRGGNPE